MEQAAFDKLIILTSPSGAGKTTITRHLLKTFPQLAFSISATTRSIRKGEINGRDYYFLSLEEFEENKLSNQFIEWEEVYKGLFYGTLISELARLNIEGKVPVLDIDVLGAQRVKKKYGDKVFTIFIKPPSIDVLIQRLKKRDTESEAELEKRVERMKFELSQEHFFDAVILNDSLDEALNEAETIVGGFLS